MNVAGTCKRLQIAAAAKFGDKFAEKEVLLRPCFYEKRPGFYYGNGVRHIDGDGLSVVGQKLHLPFLRCFGAKISNLFVAYSGMNATHKVHIDKYINQYCTDTLKSISFSYHPNISTEYFLKPFLNIEEVRIYFGHLNDQLPNLVSLFPNLRELQMFHVRIDENAIAVSFPNLKCLDLFISTIGIAQSFDDKSALNFLRLNRQLENLKIQLHDNLTVMSLDNLLDLICENLSIKKWEIYGNVTAMNTVEIDRLANEHPIIEELIFSRRCIAFSVDEIMMFIRKLKSLKHFEFEVKDQYDCDRIINQLDDKWQHKVSVEYNPNLDSHYVVVLCC